MSKESTDFLLDLQKDCEHYWIPVYYDEDSADPDEWKCSRCAKIKLGRSEFWDMS